MNDTSERKPIYFQTPFGAFSWIPNWDAFNKHLVTPVKQAVAEAEDKSRFANAHFLIRNYLDWFVLCNLQEAIIQAADELTALAKASIAENQHERNDLAQSVAEEARQACLARLRHTHYFPKIAPKRGEKRLLSVKEAFSELYDKYFTREKQILNAIAWLMETNCGKEPTMKQVAELLNQGTPNTRRGNDTGRRMLARELESINPGQKARDIFNRLIETAKTGLSSRINLSA